MVGRLNELSQLTGAVAAGRGAVITGSAGVGKTTLALGGVEWAQQRGMAYRRATATRASQGLPFGAFASLLPLQHTDADAAREDLGVLLGRYARALVEEAHGLPLLVFVDDAHLLDNGSAILVHQLALTQAATVLATVRAGEVLPDPVLSLWKDGPAERIEIGVLDDATIEELLVLALGGPVDAASVRELAGRSRGNPLFLRELVHGALETGVLVDAGGLWRLAGPLSPTVRLVELVALRLGDLSKSERLVLELLALGEPLGPAELAQLADPLAVDTLEGERLITSGMQGSRIEIRLAHPVYGDVVGAGISARRERILARSLAEVIEAVGAHRKGDRLKVASLRLVGGGGSAELLLRGAREARARHEYALTERLAQAAIEAGAGFEARLVTSEAAHFQGRFDQAEQELAALAAQATSDAEKARVALLRFDNVFLKGNAGLQIIDDTLAVITDAGWRDDLVNRRLFAAAIVSGPRTTLEVATTWSHRPNPALGVAVAHALVRIGRLDEAIEELTPLPGSRAVPAPDEPWHEWMLFGNRVAALISSGRLGDADELLTLAYGQVMDHPAAEGRAFVSDWLAVLRVEQGRPVSAFRRASEAYTLYQQLGRESLAQRSYVAAVHALAMSGRAEQVAETLAALDAIDAPVFTAFRTVLLQAQAWAAVATGDLPAARARLEEAADHGQEVGHLVGAACALHALARLGHARQVAGRLDSLAAQIDGEFVVARASYANAVAARDAVALRMVSESFEHMGALLYAAEASTEAAAVSRRAGHPREAAADESRAAQLLSHCEGAATPAVRNISARARLTPGELDAAVQAAAGRSNKHIAADSHVSVRTVESHLQRVYEKLGISSRRELANALRDEPGI
ncbi:MAG: transcriptional regulator, LuxR family [Mycobacterium sp.]|nr:transcriptional regulator, LuxR family [Mycobacterium sp.]